MRACGGDGGGSGGRARLNGWLSARSWGTPSGDPHHVLENARDLGSLGNVGALGMGQYWYVFVATFGLVVLGLVYVGARLVPPRPLRRHPTLDWAAGGETAGAPVVSAFLMGSLIGLTVLVGLFLRPPMRPDHVVYGRYVEILVPPLLALGLVRLWTAPVRRLVVELSIGAAGTLLPRPSGSSPGWTGRKQNRSRLNGSGPIRHTGRPCGGCRMWTINNIPDEPPSRPSSGGRPLASSRMRSAWVALRAGRTNWT